MKKFNYVVLIGSLAFAALANAGGLIPVDNAYISPLYDDYGRIRSIIPDTIRFEAERLHEGRYVIYDEQPLLESSNISWVQENSYWTIGNGRSANNKTGPISGKYGWDEYVYFDTSAGQADRKGDSAYFYLPTNYDIHKFYPHAIEDAYITFDYHMYGNHTGELSVEAYDMNEKKWIVVWRLNGQKQHSAEAEWVTQYVSLEKVKTNGLVRIKARAKGGINGEIAFDNYSLSTHKFDTNIHITDMYNGYYDDNYHINWNRNFTDRFYSFFYLAKNENTLEEKVIVEEIRLQPYNVGYIDINEDELCGKLGAGEWEVGFQIWLERKPESASQVPAEFNYHANCML